jgi:predicted O-methyltransferase YrrM
MWGYGFHSFLNEYIREKKCKRILEIGVADGENARSMVSAAMSNFLPEEIEYYGFDYFSGSRHNRVREKLEKTGCAFRLFKGDTVDTLSNVIRSMPKMDLIFIDGGKSYPEAKSDWDHSKTLMHHGTAVFVHNYGFSGVRRMVDGISRDEYRIVLMHPSRDYTTAMITKNLATC